MNAKLVHNSYGKSSVRVTKVRRFPDRHELVEMKVDISLLGDFERSYTHGDNCNVIATDSMKNTVYLLAKDHSLESPESFAIYLAQHFAGTYPQVSEAKVEIDQSIWTRIDVDGTPHPTAFAAGGGELRHASAEVSKGEARVHGGFKDLLLLKTTDSAFTGFVRDQFTTLPEASDRILATEVTARWHLRDLQADFNAVFTQVRSALLSAFAGHKSDAVQQTLHVMGLAALAVHPAIGDIQLKMPNKHRTPFNFRPFGREFDNDIYVTTSEPSGEIAGYLRREQS